MTKYYISLDSKNLSSHFANGYISPQKYQKDERGNSSAHNDVQSIYAEHLLITSFLYADACNCALEIVFTEAEKGELIKIDNESLFLFEKCLPLSRVKQVIFQDTEQLKRTVANINNGSAFLRENLLNVKNDKSIDVHGILESCKASGQFEVNTILNKDMLEDYSRMLSAFSLMRVVTPTDNEYPPEYIDYFSHLSSQVSSNGTLEVDIHSGAKNFLKLNQKSVEDENLPTNTAGLYDLEKIKDDKKLSKAFLLKYGNASNARQKIDDFIDHVVNQKKGLKELPAKLAFYLGYREKYSSLRNKYNIGSREVSVKFKLDSKFDYYLLESVYQFVFNNIEQSGEFTYLDDWVPEFINIDSFEGYESELVLGKLMKGKKKQTPLEYLQRFSPNFLQDFSKIYKIIYLSCTAEIDQSDTVANQKVSFLTRKLESHFLELLNNFTRKVDDKLQEGCNETLNQKETEITELKRKLAEEKSKTIELEKKLVESDKRVVGFSTEQTEDYKILEKPNDITNNVSTVTSNIPDTSTEPHDYLDKHNQINLLQEHGEEYAGVDQSIVYDYEQSPEENMPSNPRINNEATKLLSRLGDTHTEENRRQILTNKSIPITLLKTCINELQKIDPTLNGIDPDLTNSSRKKPFIDYILNTLEFLDYKRRLPDE
jgi:hypothetical protein